MSRGRGDGGRNVPSTARLFRLKVESRGTNYEGPNVFQENLAWLELATAPPRDNVVVSSSAAHRTKPYRHSSNAGVRAYDKKKKKKAKVSKAAARVDNNPAKRIGIVARPPARLCGSSRVIRRYARARGRSFPRGGSRPLGPLSHFFITGSVLTSCLSTSGPRGHIWSR